MSPDHGRTIEDRIAEQDDDYRRAMNSAAAWGIRNQGEDVPEDIHERRYQSVIEGEKRALEARGGER